MILRFKEDKKVYKSVGIQINLTPEKEGSDLKFLVPEIGEIIISPSDVKAILSHLPNLVKEIKKE